MPLYEHYCLSCDSITEVVCKIDDRKQFVPCSKCGGTAERIISSQIQRVEPTWLESSKSALGEEAMNTITDRNDFNRYLATNGIDQIG